MRVCKLAVTGVVTHPVCKLIHVGDRTEKAHEACTDVCVLSEVKKK